MPDQDKPVDPQTALQDAAGEFGKTLAGMGREVTAAFERAGHMFVVNTALGALFQSQDGKAREALERLPEALLRQVETNGRRLSRMAREVREARPPQQ
jgi:hypothetical protein